MTDGEASKSWRALGRVPLFMLLCAVVLAFAGPVTRELPRPWMLLAIGAITVPGVYALTLLFARWEVLPLRRVGVVPDRRSLLRLGLGLGIGLLIVALHTALLGVTARVSWTRGPGVGAAEMGLTVAAFLLLSCREELAFRGYPLRALQRPLGVWGAQLAVALAFAVEHIAGGSSVIHALLGAGVGSLLYGMAAIATGWLALPIGLHAGWNLADWARGGKGSPVFWQSAVEEGYQQHAEVAYFVSYLLVMGSATLAFWWWHRRSLT